METQLKTLIDTAQGMIKEHGYCRVAGAAGLAKNTLRFAGQSDWNPTVATLSKVLVAEVKLEEKGDSPAK